MEGSMPCLCWLDIEVPLFSCTARTPAMPTQDTLKLQAATAALDFVESGMVVGLGGGSTAAMFIARLGQALQEGQLRDVVGIPSAQAVGAFARTREVPLTDLEHHPRIDVCVDGADEVSPQFDLIKGGGGFLTREKILIQASTQLIIVVDESKHSDILGQRWAVPVEVVEFGWTSQQAFLQERAAGGAVTVRRHPDGTRYRTDQGHLILDACFGPLTAPAEMAAALSARAGIVEHGLFLGMTSKLITAYADGSLKVSAPA